MSGIKKAGIISIEAVAVAAVMAMNVSAVTIDDVYVSGESGNITAEGKTTQQNVSVVAKDSNGKIIYIDLVDGVEGESFTKEMPVENKQDIYSVKFNDNEKAVENYLDVPEAVGENDAMVISRDSTAVEPGAKMRVRMSAQDVGEKDCRVFIAEYTSDDKLINVSDYKTTVNADSSGECHIDFSVPDAIGAAKMKIFVFDRYMKPYFVSACFPITEDYIYVSAEGDDNAKGTADSPYKTIEHALIAAYLKGSEHPVSICLYDGEYLYPQGLTIDYYNNIRIRAAGDNVLITSAETLDSGRFLKVTDEAVSAKIPQSAREHVVQYDLGAEGHTGFGKVTPRKGSEELVPMPIITIDGRETTNARWPNNGFAKVASVANQGSTSGENMSFAADSPNTALWGNAKNPCVFGYWKYNWAPDSYRITSVSGDVVTVDGVPSYGTREGGWYYVYNMLEELDSPGEWYIDPDTDILYIYPYNDIDKNTSVRMSFSDRDIVSVENCKNVTLEGIKISDSMGRGVSFKSSSDCMLKNCELYNLGREGVKFSNTVSCGIYSTAIHDVAASAVNVDNADFTSLKDSATVIDNCRIYKYARQARANAPAIALNASVGVDITHNEIYDGPTAAISQLGFDNHIDYNKIHDVCTEASDYGAIYTYHTYYSAGNTINYNDIYNITGKGSDALGSTVAIYLDELSGGCEINGNIIRNTDLAYLSNGGRRITFTNNIITGISDKNGGATEAIVQSPSANTYTMLLNHAKTADNARVATWAPGEYASVYENLPGDMMYYGDLFHMNVKVTGDGWTSTLTNKATGAVLGTATKTDAGLPAKGAVVFGSNCGYNTFDNIVIKDRGFKVLPLNRKVSTAIELDFSKAVDPASITADKFSIVGENGAQTDKDVSVTDTANGKVLLTLRNAANGTYDVCVDKSVRSADGDTMNADKTFKISVFKQVSDKPISISPVKDSEDVSIFADVTVNFEIPVTAEMTENAAISVSPAAAYTLKAKDNSLVIAFNDVLKSGTKYTVSCNEIETSFTTKENNSDILYQNDFTNDTTGQIPSSMTQYGPECATCAATVEAKWLSGKQNGLYFNSGAADKFSNVYVSDYTQGAGRAMINGSENWSDIEIDYDFGMGINTASISSAVMFRMTNDGGVYNGGATETIVQSPSANTYAMLLNHAKTSDNARIATWSAGECHHSRQKRCTPSSST